MQRLKSMLKYGGNFMDANWQDANIVVFSLFLSLLHNKIHFKLRIDEKQINKLFFYFIHRKFEAKYVMCLVYIRHTITSDNLVWWYIWGDVNINEDHFNTIQFTFAL